MTIRRPALALTAVATTTVALLAGPPAAQAAGRDKTPPGPVTSVSVDGHTTSKTKAALTLTWTKPTARDLKSITVYRNTKNALTGAKTLAATTAAHLVDKTVLPNHTYWYFLRAADKAGNKSTFARIMTTTSTSKTERVLAGLVTDVKGTALHGLDVTLNRGYNYSVDTSTDAAGGFTFRNAPYSARGLSLCWNGHTGNGGVANVTGYLGGCYNNRPDNDPKRANRLPLAAGEFRAVAVALRAGARLRGYVHNVKKQGVEDTDVELYDADGDQVDDASTSSTGLFTFTSVPAGRGYTVSIDARYADLPAGSTGYVSQWIGGSPIATYVPGTPLPKRGVTAFSLTGARTSTAATALLATGGAVAGTATGSNDVSIGVYDSAGNRIARAYAGSDENDNTPNPESFTAVGIPTGSYTVCAIDYDGDAASQCWTGTTEVDWNGDTSSFPAAAVGKVKVTAGATTSGVNFVLRQPGDITGQVAGVTDTDNALVAVYDSAGARVAYGTIDVGDPSYDLEVPAGAYTVCATVDGANGVSSACRTATGQSTWGGDTTNFPTGSTGAVTVTGNTTTNGVDFDFAK